MKPTLIDMEVLEDALRFENFLEEIENTLVMALLATEGKQKSIQDRAKAILKFIRETHKAKGANLK